VSVEYFKKERNSDDPKKARTDRSGLPLAAQIRWFTSGWCQTKAL